MSSTRPVYPSGNRLEVGIVSDPAAVPDPIVAADIHRPSGLIAVAHESGRISQFLIASPPGSGQLHCTPVAWTGGCDDITITRVRYITAPATVDGQPQQQQQQRLFLVASTLGAQLLIFRCDGISRLHIVGTVRSGGGAIYDLSSVVKFSATDAPSFFAACGDGCVRRFSCSAGGEGNGGNSNNNSSALALALHHNPRYVSAARSLHKQFLSDDDDDDENDNGDDQQKANENNNNKTSVHAGGKRNLNNAFKAHIRSEASKQLERNDNAAPELASDQLFTKMQKANQAVAVAACSTQRLLVFSDDLGNVMAHNISGDRRKKDFAWAVQLPLGVAMRVLVDSASNSVAVGTSANEVIFIDARLGTFGARFRHHQAPVTALCSFSSSSMLGSDNSNSNNAAAATVFASGWHDQLRAYSCPPHRECSAYDFAPGQAKRQTHYHEVVELLCSNVNDTATATDGVGIVASTTTAAATLLSFSRDGTIMAAPVDSLFQQRRGGGAGQQESKPSVIYFDTGRGVCPPATSGPLFATALSTGHDVALFAVRPTTVTPAGTLQLRGPFRIKSVFLSPPPPMSRLQTHNNSSENNNENNNGCLNPYAAFASQIRYMCVTTDVGTSVYELHLDSRATRVLGIRRIFHSFRFANHEIPEPTAAGFTQHGCFIASGHSIFRVALPNNNNSAEDDDEEEDNSNEEQQGQQQQSPSSSRRRRRGRQEEEDKNDESEDEKNDSEKQPQQQAQHREGPRTRGRRGKGQNRVKKPAPTITSERLIRYDLDSNISSIAVCHSPAPNSHNEALLKSGVYFVFVSFTNGASTFLQVSQTTDELILNHHSKALRQENIVGPRGCVGVSVMRRPGAPDEVLAYSTETMQHVAVRTALVHSYPARSNVSMLPPTSQVLVTGWNGDDSRTLAVGANGLTVTYRTADKFKQLSLGSATNNSSNKVRVNSGFVVFPEQWGQRTLVEYSDSANSDVAGGQQQRSTEEQEREVAAAEALSGIAKATLGDVAAAAGQHKGTDDVAQHERATRAAAMQSAPCVFLLERNVDRMVASLPEMWRVRKFGN